jgi:D-glycero-D-manno-heptose 1,7-bisphosphate phosphatase
MFAPIRQACILVGGRGTRLGDITRGVPKPLLDIGNGKAFLDLLIDQVTRQGFNDVVLLAGYLGDQVKTRYDGRKFGSACVRVIVEPVPHGTGGALLHARGLIEPRFLLLNGDSFFDINLRALSGEALAAECEAFIALCDVPDASRYGTVALEANRVVQFREKTRCDSGPSYISAGVYVLTTAIIDRVRSLPSSIEADIFPNIAREGKLCGRVYHNYFLDIGLPETLDRGRRELLKLSRRPAAFLDRDGVLNVDHGYVNRPDQVAWIPGAHESVRRLNDLGYRVVVVTNQAGIAHGLYSEECMHSLHNWMRDQLAAQGAFIDAIYYCPYHPEGRAKQFRCSHINRKPSPGMIRQALSDLNIDRDRSFLIGDKSTDVEAALRAGIPGYLFTGGSLSEFLDNCLCPLGMSDKEHDT